MTDGRSQERGVRVENNILSAAAAQWDGLSWVCPADGWD